MQHESSTKCPPPGCLPGMSSHTHKPSNKVGAMHTTTGSPPVGARVLCVNGRRMAEKPHKASATQTKQPNLPVHPPPNQAPLALGPNSPQAFVGVCIWDPQSPPPFAPPGGSAVWNGSPARTLPRETKQSSCTHSLGEQVSSQIQQDLI